MQAATAPAWSEYEAAIRLSVFFGLFAMMAVLEFWRPARRLAVQRARRWQHNIGLVVFDSLLLRLLFPAAAMGVAVAVEDQGWGLLPWLGLPDWFSLIVAVVLLDLVIYAQHVAVHAWPLLWRLHRVHHADPEIDVTTALRFHPLEILLSMLIKFAAIAVLGPPLLAVLVFEVLLNGMAMFNHANVRLPKRLDSILRVLVVTPDMHRVHHSQIRRETHSNFGFNLSLWDRLFGTYRAQPELGHQGMQIGLEGEHDPRWVTRLDGLLLMPFRNTRQPAIRREPGSHET